MKINKNRQILFFVSLIGIIVVTLIMGTTFAYQTLQVDYKEDSDNNLSINVGDLNVTYTSGNIINLTNMPVLPNYKTADYTEFIIDNTKSTDSVGYKISLKDITYTEALINNGLKYTLVEVDSEGNNILLHEGDFKDINGTTYDLKTRYNSYYTYIDKNEIHKIRLYIWLEETNTSVNLKDDSFKGKIEITSLFSNETGEKLVNGFKVYGNSIQESTIDLYDEVNTSLTNGYYLDSNGTEVSSYNWSITDYIPVDGNNFVLKNVGGASSSICGYDDNKTLILCEKYNLTTSNDKADIKLSSTQTIKYIRFTLYRKWTHINEIYLIEDKKPTPEEPIEIKSLGIFDETMNKYKIPITVYGRNLINNYAVYESDSTIGALTGAVITDEYVDIVRQQTYDYTYIPVELKANTPYTFFYEYEIYNRPEETTEATVVRVGLGNQHPQKTYKQNTTDKGVINYTPIKNMSTNIELIANYGSKVPAKVRFKVMLVEGTYTLDNFPEFVPYKEPITSNIYLDEPLRRVGDYSDYIDFESGKVKRNIKEITLSNSNWTRKSYSYKNNTYYYFENSINDKKTGSEILSSHYAKYGDGLGIRSIIDNNLTTGIAGSTYLPKGIYIMNDAYTDNTSFGEHIKNSKLLYVLEEPKEEHIDLSNVHIESDSSIYIKSDNGVTGTYELNNLE